MLPYEGATRLLDSLSFFEIVPPCLTIQYKYRTGTGSSQVATTLITKLAVQYVPLVSKHTYCNTYYFCIKLKGGSSKQVQYHNKTHTHTEERRGRDRDKRSAIQRRKKLSKCDTVRYGRVAYLFSSTSGFYYYSIQLYIILQLEQLDYVKWSFAFISI